MLLIYSKIAYVIAGIHCIFSIGSIILTIVNKQALMDKCDKPVNTCKQMFHIILTFNIVYVAIIIILSVCIKLLLLLLLL